MRLHLFVGWLCLAWASCANADFYGLADDLQPKDYRSAEGSVVLHVVPSERDGAGAATYTLRRGDDVVWSGQRELTLWDADVAESGVAVGYAYDEGFHGGGEFIVVRIDADGTFERLASVERQDSGALHAMPEPQGRGVWIDEARDRFVVRVDEAEAAESWWAYELATSRALDRVTPRNATETYTWIVDARPVPGTALVLVQWYIGGDRERMRLTLVDDAARPRWTRDLPLAANEGSSDRFFVAGGWQAGTFRVKDAAAKQHVTFRVKTDGKAVTVAPVHRSSADENPAARASDAVPLRELELLGSIAIGQSAPEHPIPAEIDDFAFDPRGRFAILGRTDCERPGDANVTLVERDGTPVRTFIVPASDCSASGRSIAWAGGEQWLVALESDETSAAVVWLLDAGTGEQRKLEALQAPGFDALAAFDGRIVALATLREKSTMNTNLHGFDRDGRQTWFVEDQHGDEAAVFSAEDVTVTTAGQVVVLEGVAKKLKVFDLAGKHVATIDLAEAWGYEPNYPTSVASDGADGVVVYDFQGPHTVVRMSLDGQVIERFTPKYADGRTFHVQTKVTGDGAGHYWTSDAFLLLRLDAAGRTVETLGQPTQTERLTEVAALEIRRDGTLFAADLRSGSIHVIDAQGAPLRICKPAPGDIDGTFSGSLSVDAAGHVVAQPDSSSDVYVRYDADCKRLGAEEGKGGLSPEWIVQPDGSARWELAFKAVRLVGADGVLRAEIERGPADEWITSPGPAGIAPDGALAVFLNEGLPVGTPRSVAIYSATGQASHSWPTPSGVVRWVSRLAFDGEHVVLPIAAPGVEKTIELLVVARDGTPQFRFRPASGREPALAAFVGAAETTELWVFDNQRTIDRYAWPVAGR